MLRFTISMPRMHQLMKTRGFCSKVSSQEKRLEDMIISSVCWNDINTQIQVGSTSLRIFGLHPEMTLSDKATLHQAIQQSKSDTKVLLDICEEECKHFLQKDSPQPFPLSIISIIQDKEAGQNLLERSSEKDIHFVGREISISKNRIQLLQYQKLGHMDGVQNIHQILPLLKSSAETLENKTGQNLPDSFNQSLRTPNFYERLQQSNQYSFLAQHFTWHHSLYLYWRLERFLDFSKKKSQKEELLLICNSLAVPFLTALLQESTKQNKVFNISNAEKEKIFTSQMIAVKRYGNIMAFSLLSLTLYFLSDTVFSILQPIFFSDI